MLASFLPEPLHPAVVHLPIALTLLLLPFAVGALWAIRRGATPLRAWGIAAALSALLTFSSWVAVETGEQTAERVERVTSDAPVEEHEEAAEGFLTISTVVLGIVLVGLRSGRVGQAARLFGTAGAVVLLVAGWHVGHSGGALVYRHGAASAYTAAPGADVANDGESNAADRRRARGDDDR